MSDADDLATPAERDADGEPERGWWPSPWSASVVAQGKVSRGGLQVDGGTVYWSESRPHDGGRQVVVGYGPGSTPSDASPPGVSVRSRVHEYGGGECTVADGVLFYVDQADQQWHRLDGPGSTPVRLTPSAEGRAPVAGEGGAGADAPATRYADGRVTPSGRWLVSVEERESGGQTSHRLVALATDGSGCMVTLTEEGDFVVAPRLAPDGARLAWMTWDHPSMPWDSSEIRVARLSESGAGIAVSDTRRVAGGPGIAVGQPLWLRDGSLVFVDDRTGWWLPYRLDPGELEDGAPGQLLAEAEAEFHGPLWVLGQSTLCQLPDGSLVSRMRQNGRDRLVRLPTVGWTATAPEIIDQPCVSITSVSSAVDPASGLVWVLGSTNREGHAVFEVDLGTGAARRVSEGGSVAAASAPVSGARLFTADTPTGPVPGQFFAPAGEGMGAAGRRPPLIVFCHGGPTSSAEPGFDPVVQYFTSRGYGVAAVDYRGSTGYGRAYRQRLRGAWGESDVDDCVHFAEALDQAGWVDGERMAIRGTSAGGMTALAALVRSTRFAGAAAWYGVTDLEALATDTHDFESRYLDSLVGPWPDEMARYRDRSPIHHPDLVTGSVLLLQGADDPVVPADQAERFAAMLEHYRVPCRLTVFPGESHGFRAAATIEASLDAELEFYRSLFAHPGRRAAPTGAR